MQAQHVYRDSAHLVRHAGAGLVSVHEVLCLIHFLLPNGALVSMSDHSKMTILFTAGGRIKCRRCQATSKRTHRQCQAPAIKGKNTCRIHGGKSTGPKTEHGRQRCADVRLKHGKETRTEREKRSQTIAELHTLLEIGKIAGIFAKNVKMRGRKPNRK